MKICCKHCDSPNCDGCNITILAEMLQKGQLNGYMTDNHTIDPKRFIQERKTPTITGATLLSVEEAEKLPDHLRKYNGWWRLRSPGNYQDCAATVTYGGSVDCIGDIVDFDRACVRPALKISNRESSGLKVGDRFYFSNVEFEVISSDLAFCVTDIGYCAFRENWKAADANIYEASDIKKFVDDWFNNALKLS